MLKPKLRIDAQAALCNIIRSAMEKDHNYLYQCCLNCENFHEGKNICLLVNKTPPAKIITFGCEKWVDRDEIPF